MAEITIIGAGIAGSAAGLLLARDGHSVTVLERDPGPLPADVDEAWDSWDRRAVNQFRMPHGLLTGGTLILRDQLPDVARRLEDVGGLRLNLVDDLVRRIGASSEPDDARFETLTGRRTTIEWVLAKALEAEPRVSVRRGVAVSGLVADVPVSTAAPHVTGVCLDDGEHIAADLVVDATGRNSPTVRWLAALGGPPPVEIIEESGFAYYSRFFKSADGSIPEMRAPMVTELGSISILTLPSDNGTWSTMIYAAANDKPLRRLRESAVFESVLRQCPLHAHWLDGEPISEMASMVGVSDRRRTFLVDDEPVVTGLVSIGDAAACTNPSLGRGMTFALMHTVILRDVVQKFVDDPLELARHFGDRIALEMGPWYDETRQMDRGRIDEMQTNAGGARVEMTPARAAKVALVTAAQVDMTVARAWGRILLCMAPASEVLADQRLLERAFEVAPTVPDQPLGPDRSRLLELVS